MIALQEGMALLCVPTGKGETVNMQCSGVIYSCVGCFVATVSRVREAPSECWAAAVARMQEDILF